MGLFCASIHLKTADSRAVKRAVSEIVDDPEVLDAAGGWVSAYAPGLLERFEAERKHPAAFVSHRLGLRSISFSVYDSDIARYWLHNNGELRDSFNSWPGYFEDAAPQPAGGDPAELLSLCEPGIDRETIRRVLRSDSVFADDIVAGVAELVGINEERALQDHRDLHAPPTSRGRDRDLSDVLAALPDAATLGQGDHDTDPAAAALAEAATVGDVATLQRMAADTTDIDRPAPTPVPGLEALAGLGMTYPGAAPQLPMSPLLAAVTHRQVDAVAVLLEVGADPDGFNEFYGTPVFAACGAGYPDILKVLLEHGGNPNARDARGQTPLQALEQGRRSLEAVAQTRSSLESLGLTVPPELEQLMTAALPTEGWDACEEILRQRGGQT